MSWSNRFDIQAQVQWEVFELNGGFKQTQKFEHVAHRYAPSRKLTPQDFSSYGIEMQQTNQSHLLVKQEMQPRFSLGTKHAFPRNRFDQCRESWSYHRVINSMIGRGFFRTYSV